MKFKFILFGIIVYFIIQVKSQNAQIVNTTSGQIQGFNKGNVSIFLGIPYANPPVGNFRWAPPTSKTPWSGIHVANVTANVCVQYKEQNSSEDCLYLNIYTPNITTTTPYPVIFWIHGGGYTIGTPNKYDGSRLASNTSSVVVLIAYRLNIFGFFALPEMNGNPLNFGLLDQQFALQWVNQNIHQFGGDPTKVMIVGESAGAGSVSYHLLMQNSFSLYSSAVLESSPVALAVNLTQAIQIGVAYSANFGCNTLACMRALYASTIQIQTQYANFSFVPYVDGVTVTDIPLRLYQSGSYNKNVPIIVGTNLEEGNLLNYVVYGIPLGVVSDSAYLSDLNVNIPPEIVPQVTQWYYTIKNQQGNWKALAQIFGDYLINCPTDYMVNIIAKTSNSQIFRYLFTHPPVNWIYSDYNATHYAEVSFVFNSPSANGMSNFTNQEQVLATIMSQMWATFAKTGNPTTNFPFQWPDYKTSNVVLVLDIGYPLVNQTLSFPMCANWIPYLTNNITSNTSNNITTAAVTTIGTTTIATSGTNYSTQSNNALQFFTKLNVQYIVIVYVVFLLILL